MAVPAVFALVVSAIGVLALVVVANRRRRSGINPLHSQTSGDTHVPMMFMGDSGSGSSVDCADGSAADSGGCDGGGGDGGGGGGGD
jgi:uncharacterized membrane protein YgcG